MKLTEQCDGHMFRQTWKMLSKLNLRTKTIGLKRSVVLLTNPGWSIESTKNGTNIYIRAAQGHSHVVAINPNLFSLRRISLHWKEQKIQYRKLFQLQTNPGEWSVGRKIESKKHETSVFLLTSESARIVIATANDRLERARC